MAKPTAQLLAQLKQTQEYAEVFKSLWQDHFPPDLVLPADWEIKNAVRRLTLADLEEGMKSYLVILSNSKASPTPKGVLSYLCGTAHNIREKENPNQKLPPTPRRLRNAARDPNSPQWDGDTFGNATPEERQKIMAEIIARQKKVQ